MPDETQACLCGGTEFDRVKIERPGQPLYDRIHRLPALRRHVLRADQAGRLGRRTSGADGSEAPARVVSAGLKIPRA